MVGRAALVLGSVLVTLLALWVVESVTIAVDQFLGAAADPSSPVVSAVMTPVFAGVALVMLVPTVAMLHRIGPVADPLPVDARR